MDEQNASYLNSESSRHLIGCSAFLLERGRIMMKKFCLFIFGLTFLLVSNSLAKDKVVVIPLFSSEAKSSTAPVEKTGQRTSYAKGDDGDLEKGVVWPNPRFKDNGDGTVTDNLTGLIWLKNASCLGPQKWSDALSDCNDLRAGFCGLTDGSSAGDWRLPNIKELQSLIDYSTYDPALPYGHPFSGVQSGYHWSGTTSKAEEGAAWFLWLRYGIVAADSKDELSIYVWPVRDGN